ncbi:MAG: hypothetical protein ACLTSG_09915 [Lachnospiraceae bacterium]
MLSFTAFFTALDVVSDRMPTTFAAVTVTFYVFANVAAVRMYSLSLPTRSRARLYLCRHCSGTTCRRV